MERRVFVGLVSSTPLQSYASLVGATIQPNPDLIVDYLPKGVSPIYDGSGHSGYQDNVYWRLLPTGQWEEQHMENKQLLSNAAIHIQVDSLELRLNAWLQDGADPGDLHILSIQDVREGVGSGPWVSAGLLRIPGPGFDEVPLLAALFARSKAWKAL